MSCKTVQENSQKTSNQQRGFKIIYFEKCAASLCANSLCKDATISNLNTIIQFRNLKLQLGKDNIWVLSQLPHCGINQVLTLQHHLIQKSLKHQISETYLRFTYRIFFRIIFNIVYIIYFCFRLMSPNRNNTYNMVQSLLHGVVPWKYQTCFGGLHCNWAFPGYLFC